MGQRPQVRLPPKKPSTAIRRSPGAADEEAPAAASALRHRRPARPAGGRDVREEENGNQRMVFGPLYLSLSLSLSLTLVKIR